MNKYIFLFLIFFVGGILRFWHLGLNPPSLDWDEASLGYNAYSILKTGKDEYGTWFPLSIRSFGDYKPPLYTYLTIPWVALWGMNEFSVRFISALLGSLTVCLTYLLVYEISGRKRHRFALLASYFLSISPWHVQFSRIAFESNVSVFFVVLGVYASLVALRNHRYFFVAAGSFALSLYAYHSPRVFVPLFLMGFTYRYRGYLWQSFRPVVFSGIVFSLLVLPILLQMASSTGARFGSVTIMNPAERLGRSIQRIEKDREEGNLLGEITHNRRFVYGRDILAGYLDHWDVDFLFLNGDAPGRHHAAGMGMLYWWEIITFPIGIYSIWKKRMSGSALLFWWYVVAPAASSLTSGTPHAVRALLFLPIYQICSAEGVIGIFRSRLLRERRFLKNVVYFFSFFVFLFSFYYYMSSYWIHSPVEQAREWQYGYKEAVEIAKRIEDQYDKIVMTYAYDQPYVFVLFYQMIDPSWYQSQWPGGEIERFSRNFGKYEFRRIEWEQEKEKTNTLFIGTGEEIPKETPGWITDVHFPDGTVSFRIVGR